MKTVATGLQTHIDTGMSTLCWLLRIIPVNVAEFGVTSQVVDVPYDDGDGSITYSASLGLNLASIQELEGLEVSSSEAKILIGGLFTKESIAAGVFDYAEFKLYRVNWNNTSDGNYIGFTGTFGQVRSEDGLSATVELRGLTQLLKQNYVDLYSISCRAKFASQVGEELFPCTFDDASLFQNLGVDSVGAEADRIFTADGTPAATGPNGALPFDVALLEWLTGNNTGLISETETVTGAVITLRFQSAYDIEVGDTFKIRPDCRKRFSDDCVDLFDNAPFFRGEPWIPVMEEGTTQVPGANRRGTGAPIVIPDEPPYSPPSLEGALDYLDFFEPIENFRATQEYVFFVPTGGLTLYFTIPVIGVPKKWGFIAVPNTSSNGAKQGSVSTVVGDYAAIPNTLSLTGGDVIGGAINSDATAEADDNLRIFVEGQIYFMNFMYTDGEENWIDIRVFVQDP